jgi:hypothetical protein
LLMAGVVWLMWAAAKKVERARPKSHRREVF